MQCTLQSPAKINLQLRVVGKRVDGYHLLDMVMVPLAFADDIVVTIGERASQCDSGYLNGGISLAQDVDPAFMTASLEHINLDNSHLCFRAAQAMRSAAGIDQDVHIAVTKRIPAGGGLGGGSSNAAAVLKALNDLWGLGWSAQRLAEIGVSLGADVPFFCFAGPAHVSGIGEKVVEYQSFPASYVLLVNPDVHVPTADVFASLDFELTAEIAGAIPPQLQRFEHLTRCLENDLEAAAVAKFPRIAEVKQRVHALGGHALMSGSGSTVFGLFEHEASCREAAKRLQNEGFEFVVVTRFCSQRLKKCGDA